MILHDPLIYYNKDDNEVWKPLIYHGINPGEYLISNFGNIYDLKMNKYVRHSNQSAGYESVTLRHNDSIKSGSLLVHRLVAENFVAEKENDQIQVNHKNGNKKYNHDINLEWSTPKENSQHAFQTGLALNHIGENSHLAKFTNDEVRQICEMLSKGMRYKEILSTMNIPITDNNMDMIGNIYRGIAWGHISKDYTFPEYDQRFRSNSKEVIEDICKYIELGLDNKAVYEKVFGKTLKSARDDKQNYELIRLIRNRKSFIDISCKYKF